MNLDNHLKTTIYIYILIQYLKVRKSLGKLLKLSGFKMLIS